MVDLWEITGALKIQDGGRQTGNSHISSCRLDSGKIQTDLPIFSRYPKPIILPAIPHNVTGSGKSKMAVTKPEIKIYHLVC